VSESPPAGMTALPAASLDVHDRIWHARDDFERVLNWGIWTSIWLLSLGALGVAFIWFHSNSAYQVVALLDLIVGGLIFVGWSVRTLWISIRARRQLLDWEGAILPFLYKVKFELLPITGADRAHDIWERYKSIYQDLTEIESRSLSARINLRLGSSALKFGTAIKGAKGRHVFDIYGATFGKRTLFVRRFDQGSPVTRGQLSEFKEEIEDRLKRVDEHICVVGAFSRGGFEPDAISFVQDDSSLVDKSYPIDLIRETETGYAIVFVDSD
jgi:hypothetical protein